MISELSDKTDEALEARLRAICKPVALIAPGKSGLAGMHQAQLDRQAWEAANPTLDVEHRALRAEQERRRALALEEQDKRAEEERTQRRIEASGAGSRNLQVLSVGLTETTAVAEVRKFLDGGKIFLLLSGRPGVGKSVAAMLAVERFAKAGRQSRFARAVECNRMPMFEESTREAIALMRRVPLLVLDDLGVETLNDAWRETLDDVVDWRYQERASTIFTTNLPPASKDPTVPTFKSRYGDRISDRIRQDGLIAMCGTESLRTREP